MPNLQELIREAQEIGGFSYFSWHSTFRNTGNQVLAQKGFRADKKETARILDESSCGFCSEVIQYNYPGTGSSDSKKPLDISEVVAHRKLTKSVKTGQKQVGVRKTGFLGLKKEPIYEDVYEAVTAQTQDFVENGSQKEASKLFYSCLRKERDDGGRPGACIALGLTAPTRLVEQLLSEIKKDPSRAYEIFEGMFPDWEEKYHRNPNGRMLIGEEKELRSKFGGHRSTDRFEDLVVEYQTE